MMLDLAADPYRPSDPSSATQPPLKTVKAWNAPRSTPAHQRGDNEWSWDDGPPPPSAPPLILLEETQVSVPVCEAVGWSMGFPIMPPPPPLQPPLPPPQPRCGRCMILGFALVGLVATVATATILAIAIKPFVPDPVMSTTSTTTPFSSDISSLSSLAPSTAPSACLRVTTGKAANDDGMVQIYVDYGNGFVLVNSESLAYVSYTFGQTVVNQCWGTIEEVQVSNPNGNAWTGSIEISLDSGKTYHPLVCSDLCTGTTRDTMSIVVDGGADSGDQATTQCFNSNKCKLVHYT